MANYMLFVFIVTFTTVASATASKQYRTDYEYNKRTDAFYKLHQDRIQSYQLSRATEACEAEGAELMTPRSDQDVAQVHAMLKKYPDIGNYVYVASDGEEHESAEEPAIIDLSVESEEEPMNGYEVISRDGKVLAVSRFSGLATPYVCKVEASKVPYDQQCGVHANNYTYVESTGSCYKVPKIAYTWYQAYDDCQAQGAHLAVINSDAERLAVQNIVNSAQCNRGSHHSWYFLIGFRAEKYPGDGPRVFKTIFNQTLEEAGFSEWSATEPNNLGGNENCGSVFKDDGKLNDVSCLHSYNYVCEKEVTH